MARALSTHLRPVRLGVALALLLAVSGSARANPDSGVDGQLFRPALDTKGLISLDSAAGLAQYDFGLKLDVSYAQNPLKAPVPGIGTGAGNTDSDSVLKFALNLNMVAAFAFTDRLSFGLDVGLVRTATDEGYGERGLYRETGSEPSTGLIALRPLSNIDPSGGFNPDGHSVPLDVRLGLKYQLVKSGSLAVSVLGIVSVPFGDEEMFLGDQSFVFEPKLALDYGLGGNNKIVANLSTRLRKRTVLESYVANAGQTENDAVAVLDVGSEVVAGIGLLYSLAPQLALAAEATYFQPLPEGASFGTCRRSNGELCSSLTDADYFAGASYGDPAAMALASVSYRATPDTSLSLGGGIAGLIGDGRGEDFRFLAGVSWAPTPEGSTTIGRGDADGDGVPDRIDICQDEPEDKDGYQDDDGCPDLDNDGDGVIDAEDECSLEPEDRDGYQDQDGCPERDNDGDNVADVTDRCPNDPEDIDKFEDDDGCPDEDNDGDGIADQDDACPNEAETVNGVKDSDGCPDDLSGGGVQMDPGRIDLRGARIEFVGRSARLNPVSRTLLDDVAKLLSEPENADKRIRIEVHVPLGTRSNNARAVRRQSQLDKQLTDRRAAAIRDYLIEHGVSGARLQAAGLGSRLPITQPATDGANERVDFIRVDQR